MNTVAPSSETAPRYYAEFQHGMQVTRRRVGPRREDCLTIIAPRLGPDAVARFTAPSVPGRMAADDLLKANAWHALGPWEYIAGQNLYRARVEPLRPLITTGQAAVRAAEQHGSPSTVSGVDRALCQLPVTDMDAQAHRILHDALRALAYAEDAEEWQLLAAAEHAVSRLVHEPNGATLEHPAVRAVGELAIRCGIRHDRAGDTEAPAWHRGYLAGMETLGAVTGLIYRSSNGRALDKAMTEFVAAVRRAIPYEALYEARQALVEAARTYNIFVIGMRQPMPFGGRWEWARRIGDAVYLFEVEPPLVDGSPYGAVAVRRTAADGMAGPVRYFLLGADEERRRAVTEARYRI